MLEIHIGRGTKRSRASRIRMCNVSCILGNPKFDSSVLHSTRIYTSFLKGFGYIDLSSIFSWHNLKYPILGWWWYILCQDNICLPVANVSNSQASHLQLLSLNMYGMNHSKLKKKRVWTVLLKSYLFLWAEPGAHLRLHGLPLLPWEENLCIRLGKSYMDSCGYHWKFDRLKQVFWSIWTDFISLC